MVGKVSERVLLREGMVHHCLSLKQLGCCSLQIANKIIPGLERTDNGMKLTQWPDVTPINQKNYYTYNYPFPHVIDPY